MKKQNNNIVFFATSILVLIFLPSLFTPVYGYEEEWNIDEGNIFKFDFHTNFTSADDPSLLYTSNFTFQIKILNLSSESYGQCVLNCTPIEIYQDDLNHTDRMPFYDSPLLSRLTLSPLLLSRSYIDFYNQSYWNVSFYEDDLYDPEEPTWENYGKYQNLTIYPYGCQYIQDFDSDTIMGWKRLEFLEIFNEMGVLKHSQYNITGNDGSFGMSNLTLLPPDVPDVQKRIGIGMDFVGYSFLTIYIYLIAIKKKAKKSEIKLNLQFEV